MSFFLSFTALLKDGLNNAQQILSASNGHPATFLAMIF